MAADSDYILQEDLRWIQHFQPILRVEREIDLLYRTGWFKLDGVDLASHKKQLEERLKEPTLLPYLAEYTQKLQQLQREFHIHEVEFHNKFNRLNEEEQVEWVLCLEKIDRRGGGEVKERYPMDKTPVEIYYKKT